MGCGECCDTVLMLRENDGTANNRETHGNKQGVTKRWSLRRRMARYNTYTGSRLGKANEPPLFPLQAPEG